MTFQVNIYGNVPDDQRGQDIVEALRNLDWNAIPGVTTATVMGTDSQGAFSQSFVAREAVAQGTAEPSDAEPYIETPATDPRPWDHGANVDVQPKPLVPQEPEDAPAAPVAAPVAFHANAGPGAVASIEERAAAESIDAAQIAPTANVTTPAGERPPSADDQTYVPDTEQPVSHDEHPEDVTEEGQEPDNAHDLEEQPDPSPEEAAVPEPDNG